ncbi:MAG: UDP-N-acetylmuramoyl-L-alanyl-D-glutamate--2,6-diaminopimelate ligase [Methylococcales bacterium]|nr:UDP-N-acetylmuramoyl-L-alanyl-D-glutamate--2,6-diaminopimelate ligase [Methylococcales bacterium]
MKINLTELLNGITDEYKLSEPECNFEIKGLSLDSRKVEKGFIFIAVAGATQHGLFFIQQAIKNGAFSVVYDPQGSESFPLDELAIHSIGIKNLGSKLGVIANRFYQFPSTELDVIGITGTNGKTTCSQFLLQVLPRCGVIGTLGWGEKGGLKETVNTTPDALAVHSMLANFVNSNKKTVVMEVSSHGLQQGRVNSVSFKGTLFINLSRDHLDYHGSMAEYLQAKLALFKQPDLQFVVVNTDDTNSELFLAAAPKQAKQWGFSVAGNKNHSTENVVADKIDCSLNGVKFLAYWRNEKAWVQTKIVGDFNVENLLAVITVLLAQGYSLNVAAKMVEQLIPVKGRMENFGGEGKPIVFVDYAHTPDALEKLLKNLNKYSAEKIYLIFGCGGNRDKGKRAQMAKIAENFADHIVITNDNPRFERPEQIVKEIIYGFKNKECEVIQNREKAIQKVIKKANKNDCVVIAGKGHEEYQEINGIKHPFSDQDIVMRELHQWTPSQ